jgi:predicted DCC family thiol-disulfide oxidoreductase YuxK
MTEEKKKTFQYVTLGLPEIKMVLVHAGNDSQNAVSNSIFVDKTKEQLEKEQAVRKIIEHLKVDP